VSYNFPRTIRYVAGSLNIDQYTTVLESVAAPGRTIVFSHSPVYSSTRLKEWISAHKMPDIMPMTSIWRQFIQEFNKFGPFIGTVNELWGEIEYHWDKFIFNQFHVLTSTVHRFSKLKNTKTVFAIFMETSVCYHFDPSFFKV
jgi:hypothetical protein